MGQSQIEDKLAVQLKKKIKSELQVVYILSRIRKILEIKNLKERYPVLNFYCNWSLHSEITKTDGKKINSILKEFIEKPEEKYKLSLHLQFSDELIEFLRQFSLPILNNEQLITFRFILGKIISDTPIKVVIGTKYKIIFKEPGTRDESGLHLITIDDKDYKDVYNITMGACEKEFKQKS